MPGKNKPGTENTDVLREQLKKKVDSAVGERQNNISYLRSLGGSKHVWEAACDDVFDAVEGSLVDSVKKRIALQKDFDPADPIGDIAWAVVAFLTEIAHSRLQLDRLIRDKCEELVNGDVCRNWKRKACKKRSEGRITT